MITAKLARDRAGECAELVREMLESLDDGFCVIEVIFDESGRRAIDYRFLEVNRAFALHTGLADVQGRTARELVPDLDALWFETYGRVVLTGESIRFAHLDAAMQRLFEVQAMPFGERRLAVVFRDITEQRKREDLLRTSESTLRSIVEATSYLIGVVEVPDDDSDVVHVYQSPPTERYLGLAPGSMRDASMRSLGVAQATIDTWIRHYREAQRARRSVRFEYVQLGPHGPRSMESTVAYIGPAGPGRARFSYITEDVTERTRAAQRERGREIHLRLAMRSSLAVAFEWDIPGNRVRRLESFEEAFPMGEGLPDTLEGVLAIVHPEDRELFRANVDAALASDTGEYRSEYRIVRSTGEVRWFVETGQIEFDDAHRPLRLLGISQDVTRRRRADDERRRQAQLISLSHEPILAWSRGAGILEWNAGAEQLYGYTREEALGRDVHQLLRTQHPMPLERFLAALERTGEWQGELHHVAKDGRRLVVESRQQAIEISGSRLILESNRDITERKRADDALKRSEAALRESQARADEARARAEADRALLDAVLESAPAGIIVADAAGKLLRFNPANERLWGNAPRSENVAAYREWKGWWADRSERRGRRIEPHEWAMSKALQGLTTRHDVVEIEPFGRPDERRTLLNSGAPVRDGDGRIIGAVVAQIDITDLIAAEDARLESEQRFRGIADALPGLAFVHDSEGNNLFVNKGYCASTGRSAEQLLGLGWRDLVSPADLDRFTSRFRQAVADGCPLELEVRFRRYDGAWRWFLLRTVPQRTSEGAIDQWIGTALDITERIAGEESLREADRRKDELIALLAHELRNPLAPVRSAVELMRMAPRADPRIERAREVIDRQVSHMARLIDDLLDVSRIARGKLALQLQRCDLASIARQTADDYRATLEASGLQLKVSGGGPVWVDGDPVRLAQVIGNLLNNAGRFTERGGTVEVTFGAADGRATVAVADTGVGIDQALLTRLFDPFSQAEQDLARTKGGLGLGLALTKGLVELHGGHIEAHSEGAGRGTTVTLRFPLLAAPVEHAGDAATQAGAGLRILVVEDNEDAAELLGDLLELCGHEVKLAYDGASGVSVARGFEPDVVISDLGLPGELDGFGVATALRADPATQRAYLIAMSGYSNADVREHSSQVGFDTHLAKPADLRRLKQALATAQAHRR